MATVQIITQNINVGLSTRKIIIQVRPAATINTGLGGGGGGVSSWNDLTDKPSVFPPDIALTPIPKVPWDYGTYTGDYTEFPVGTFLFYYLPDDNTWGIDEITAPGVASTVLNVPVPVMNGIGDVPGLGAALDEKQNTNEKGQPDGYMGLDAFSVMGFAHLPRIPTGYLLGRASPSTGETELLDRAAAASILAGPTGLQAYIAFTPLDAAEKAQPNGVASLDGSGKVPAAQLPSYVDDIVEVANLAALPVTGETGKIYVTVDDNSQFRWSGSTYVEFSGGGGAPGGSSGELQYNNAGAFAGAADVEIEGGQLRLASIATPTAPVSGGVKLYGTTLVGGDRLGFMGPDGKVRLLQNDLGEFSVQRFQPAVALNSAVGENSLNLGALGTTTAAAPAITNLHTMKPRLDVLVTTASGAAIASLAFSAVSARPVRVGRDANAPGGFLARFVWAPATGVSNASHRAFCGLHGETGTQTDVEPSTKTSIVCMGWDAADANIQIMHNDASGTCTKIDLGASFPVPTVDRSQVYELQLHSPNSLTQSVSYRVIRYNTTDNTIAAEATGTITTNLPPVGTLLGPRISMSVGGVSSVVGIACMGILIGREY